MGWPSAIFLFSESIELSGMRWILGGKSSVNYLNRRENIQPKVFALAILSFCSVAWVSGTSIETKFALGCGFFCRQSGTDETLLIMDNNSFYHPCYWCPWRRGGLAYGGLPSDSDIQLGGLTSGEYWQLRDFCGNSVLTFRCAFEQVLNYKHALLVPFTSIYSTNLWYKVLSCVALKSIHIFPPDAAGRGLDWK